MIFENEMPLDDSTHEPLDILKYKYALENSEIGVWEWDIATNKIYHSAQLKTIFGYEDPDVDLTEIHWSERIHPDDVDALVQLVDNHLKNITKEYRSEHRIVCPDGSYKWVFDCGKVVSHDACNNPTRLIGTTIDITQRKLDEENVKQSLSIITNQNKKLTNFAHIVTHNLKEHAGNFESLLNFYKEAEGIQEKDDIINHLKTVSDSLTKTIGNLRDIVSKQLNRKIEIKPLNIHHYVNKTAALLELDILNKKAIVINDVNKDLVLHSNEAYLESIILNLASNALKYSHPDRVPIIKIDSTVSKDEVTVRVSDNGIGINLEKFGNDIFGLYNTFHGNDNAEGVGLYITKSQIESLGGTISVESTVDVGTSFIIHIKPKKSS
jgi:PAS domain S-box-containing protein